MQPLGLLTGSFSAIAFGVYAILARARIRQVDSWTVLLYALGSGAVAWSLIVQTWKAYLSGYAPVEWLLFGFIAIFAPLLPFGLFPYGLRRIPPSLASLTSPAEPGDRRAAAMA